MDMPEPTTVEILEDGEKIAGFLVKPWTISKCARLTPAFEKIAGELKKRKLTFRDFFAMKKNEDGTTGVEILNLDQLMFSIMPAVPEVLKITLDAGDAEIDKIRQDDVMKFVVVIVRQNFDYVKNLFALMSTLAEMVQRGTTGSLGQ